MQHLEFLEDTEKAVFKTAFELDQRRIIELAGDRTPYVCQAQSLNIFLKPDVNKRDLHMIHFSAWKRGVKSLYYLRSLSIQRAEVVSHNKKDKVYAIQFRRRKDSKRIVGQRRKITKIDIK